ncbi:hypothetical protein [Schlesneria paludicola]|uniref:hypothetical protein n=1 Tax=Schlesneria paludicola TaxID=360056 RepID=UPI00029AC259|nr:hypothetical protein [Schlesneria paludicola]
MLTENVSRSCLLVLAAAGLAVCAVGGCGRSNQPARIAVTGEVVLDQKPLDSGRIMFIPIDGTKGPTATAFVKDGFYSFDRKNGPVVGKNKVHIESVPKLEFELDDEAAYANAHRANHGKPVLPPEKIPPQYNRDSTLVAELSLAGNAEVNFALERSVAQRSR